MNYICKCPKSDFSKHNFAYWEDRNTTSDELEIIDFLENSVTICDVNFCVFILYQQYYL